MAYYIKRSAIPSVDDKTLLRTSLFVKSYYSIAIQVNHLLLFRIPLTFAQIVFYL